MIPGIIASAVRVATGAWTPALLPNRIIHVDASDAETIDLDGSGNVSEWRDKSGNINHLTQTSSVLRPGLIGGAVNNLDAIRFENDNCVSLGAPLFQGQYSETTILSVIHTRTMRSGAPYFHFVILQGTDTNSIFTLTLDTRPDEGPVFGWDDNEHRYHGDDVFAESNTPYIHTWTATNAASKAWENGWGLGEKIRTTNSPDSTHDFRLGTDEDGRSLEGDICEVIIYDGVLDTANREKLEGYAAHKWGMAGLLPTDHPYKNDAP